MKALHKGIALALIHIAIVCSLGAKLMIDRATRPRIWVKALAYDPNLPVRGRYASMRLVVEAPQAKAMEKYPSGEEYSPYPERARLEVKDGKIVAVDDEWGSVYYQRRSAKEVALSTPVTFFINEKVKDPTWRERDEELWVEVTVPKKGLPRPIQLAVKKNGTMTPLKLD